MEKDFLYFPKRVFLRVYIEKYSIRDTKLKLIYFLFKCPLKLLIKVCELFYNINFVFLNLT